jgi:2-(1,2-epoxy-1,2-dihydrophenyl)acetyl-CoA isomerase
VNSDRSALAKQLYEALATGDRAVLGEILAPDFVGSTTAGLPLGLGGTFKSAEEMQRDFWWRIGKAYKARAEPESFEPLGDDRLLVSGTYRGTARATARPLEARFVHVLSFAEGRISGLTQLTDSAAWHAALEGARAQVPAYSGPSAAELETIEYEVREHVAVVRLNRPGQHNAINLRLAEETLTVARAIASDPAVRAVLIAGNGPALTVGGDIEYFRTALPGSFGTLAARMTDPFHEAFRILERIDAPIVTAAHGAVAGGGLGFVYAADITLAAEGTIFTTAFSGIGVSGDGGGTWHLPRLIGAARARRMYLENLRLDAETALAWGLVAELVPAEELRDRAWALAARLAAGPTRAFAIQRRLLRDSWQATFSDQLRAESDGIAASGNTHDAWGAVSAFLDKRRPTFEGR